MFIICLLLYYIIKEKILILFLNIKSLKRVNKKSNEKKMKFKKFHEICCININEFYRIFISFFTFSK